MPAEKNRSLQRGLKTLEALNRHGMLKAGRIAKLTQIPRPTVYRILEALEDMGFVRCGPSDDFWRPTLRTRTLSSGYRDENQLAHVAFPRMLELGKDVRWPIDLVAFRNFRMVILESTHSTSPYSIDDGMVGRSLPILDTSAGRAFLAFSTVNERRWVLSNLAKKQVVDHPLLHDATGLEYLLNRCRQLGVGIRTEGFNPHTKSISAPIFSGEQVIACLSLIWISSAMTLEEAVLEYSEKLIDAASRIGAASAARSG